MRRRRVSTATARRAHNGRGTRCGHAFAVSVLLPKSQLARVTLPSWFHLLSESSCKHVVCSGATNQAYLRSAKFRLPCNLRSFQNYAHIDALDSGSNKSAIVACNKLLKKSPKHDHIKVRCCAFHVYRLCLYFEQALKALALVRMQKLEESQLVCDDVLAAKPSDDNTLATMNHALRGLGRSTAFVIYQISATLTKRQMPTWLRCSKRRSSSSQRTRSWAVRPSWHLSAWPTGSPLSRFGFCLVWCRLNV
jgi:hypothetical protein